MKVLARQSHQLQGNCKLHHWNPSYPPASRTLPREAHGWGRVTDVTPGRTNFRKSCLTCLQQDEEDFTEMSRDIT